ncbi:protein MpMASE2 [Marchantia polymorpha subsp. ruderalis]|nr:hypothetical protein MARPO_0063s0029 [Marchantia polymorpha]BBN19231.1 hypothetical protein Mp_8g08900 [Marchantia polymorpha subsp. ruderalis]|eukprot:PTQ36481.1 hypothetical protein MARPO_0063s0029 [Marchantia polymorpha]
MSIARRALKDDDCQNFCCQGDCPELRALFDQTESDVELGPEEEVDDPREEEVEMIQGARGNQVGTCMEIDIDGLFPTERRRSRSGLLKHYSRNVELELRNRAATLWQKIKRTRHLRFKDCCWFVMLNVAVASLLFITGIITYESSVNVLRHSLETTVLFPIYLPHAVALSVACMLKWQAFLGIFMGLYCSRIYAAARGTYLISFTRGGVLLTAAVLGTAEVYCANYLLYCQLVKEGSAKKMPTIESITEALKYLGIVVVCTFFFDTVIALLICSTPLVMWSDFTQLWGTNWLGVLAGMLTISPTTTHLFAWQRKPSLLQPKKLLEALSLTALTAALVILLFVTSWQTVIYPLPYLLFPMIILTAFRFNRLGCSLVVLLVSYVCAWASVRGKGALYRMAGSPTPVSSPKLILQVELFVSVLGVVGILLAAAVREKKQLARDLHKMNEELESTVHERTIELVKANDALKESQRKAELANQAKSEFLANMSHEIRTPIHGIMGLTSLVLDSELSLDQRDSLVSVQDCANVLLHIINSILDLAKIEAGRIEVEFVTFRMSQLVSSTVRMLHTRASDKNLELVWDLDPDLPQWLIGDYGKLQQCLLNLIGNAVKFTHEGTVRVHVRVDKSGGSGKRLPGNRTSEEPGRTASCSPRGASPTPDPDFSSTSFFESPAQWQCCNPGSSRKSPTVGVQNEESVFCVPVVVEVHDTGIGVSAEKLQDIFTPFTQADASTSRVYGGTGLGLCIVQRFVELLGGKLQAESELGKGSCFSFCVPLGYSPKNHEEKGCDIRGLINLLSTPLPHEAESSVQARCCGAAPPPQCPSPPPDAATLAPRVCSDSGDCCYLPPSDGAEHLRSHSDTRVSYSQCSLDSVGKRNSPGGSNSPARADLSVWRPRRSIENLDVLLANWNLNESRMKASECECCSTSDKSHKCCNPLCNSTTTGVGQQLLRWPSNPLDYRRNRNSPLEHISFDEPEEQSLAPSAMLECRAACPPPGAAIIDIDIPCNPRQDASCNQVETREAPCKPSGGRRQSSEPSAASARSAREDLQPKEDYLNLHVLLAEDNLVNQKVATRQLQKHKHVVTAVGDGLQALETVKADHDKFDLVLMDVQMPNMDGLEATQRIREYECQQGIKRLPILGLTAHAIQGYEETCLKSGMDGYLGKPFDIDQLLRVIHKYVPPKDAIILRR